MSRKLKYARDNFSEQTGPFKSKRSLLIAIVSVEAVTMSDIFLTDRRGRVDTWLYMTVIAGR